MKFRLTFTGNQPLLMHNSQLADPLNEYAKRLQRLTKKRTKTEDDYQEMARHEFLGGVYHHPDQGPYIPAQNIERCLVDAAKKLRLGTAVKSAIIVETNINSLMYDGPRDLEGLLADENFRLRASAKVGTQRIMRVRPQFRQWATAADGDLDANQLDIDQLRQVVEIAGHIIGLGDWRPRFGRFTGQVDEL